MTRIPFGVSRFDGQIGGGAPEGSVVLLAGSAGAGAREFLYTSAVFNGLIQNDPDLFDLHYGSLAPAAEPPEEVHYVSFSASREDVKREISFSMDEEIVKAGLGGVTFQDLSAEYFQLSPVPREWYVDEPRSLADLGGQGERRTVIQAFADYLDEHAADSLVVVDSLTDLIGDEQPERPWSDVVYLLKGLRKAVREWGGLVLLNLSRDALTESQFGELMSCVDGTIQFGWETGGNERVRSMFVQEFRGVLSQLEQEDIVRFETEIHEAGFDVSNVRKIR
ncbi:RAD55 family ATPase [Halarchaeum sp. P4]|uniref:RAD55 family ATPase n=1 Tax=Halarchaeum sp. P4 TaxID=3421639 RepID=UPI003EBB2111